MTLRNAIDTDLAPIRDLLAGNGLPITDLERSSIEFVVVEQEARIVGVAGLERHADCGLLRSLAVDGARRGSGLGMSLVREIELRARTHGLNQLVLLTQTAEAFFRRLGYEPIARASAPAPVQASAEFRALCPASAACLRKILAPELST